MKKVKCEKCGEILDGNNVKYLELSNTDGNYYETIPKGHISQGLFPFGTACATTQLRETISSISPSTPPVSELPEPSKKDAIKNACETIYALMNGEYDHLGLVEIGHLFLLDETNIQKILAHYNVSAEQFILVRQNDCKQLAETLSLYAQKNGTQQHEITQLQEHNRVLRVALEQISKRLNAFGYEGELNYQDREIVIDMHLSVMTTLNAPYLK